MRRRREYFVYILSSDWLTLYIGVTNNLERRVYEHQAMECDFTSRYDITRLVYCEEFDDIRDAIAREKQLKRWSRKKKVQLIRSSNPTWRDLSQDWAGLLPPQV